MKYKEASFGCGPTDLEIRQTVSRYSKVKYRRNRVQSSDWSSSGKYIAETLDGRLASEIEYPIPLHCNNQSAIRLAENSVFHARTKHVEVYYHFIREKFLKDEIEMQQIKIDDQVVDLFTKRLNTDKHVSFRCQLNIVQRMRTSVEGEC